MIIVIQNKDAKKCILEKGDASYVSLSFMLINTISKCVLIANVLTQISFLSIASKLQDCVASHSLLTKFGYLKTS